MTARRGFLGGRKVLERFPFTADGWSRAWVEFARLDSDAAEKTRVALATRSAERDRRSTELATARSTLVGLILSAIRPSADGLTVGQAYDLRFAEGGLQIARSGSPAAAAEFRYVDVAAVQITGFERVPFPKMEFLFAPGWYLRRNEEVRVHLRVQTSDRILDFWHASSSAGQDFARWLEPVNSAIRQAWLSATPGKGNDEGHTDWLVGELSRLTERLERGTLTRSDFEQLKIRIIGGC